jgi:hypothetical protein
MGRFKPKPFSRPLVDLGQTEKRMWQTVPAKRLRPGDNVQGIGVLGEVLLTSKADGSPCVIVSNTVDRLKQTLLASEMVFAFTVG